MEKRSVVREFREQDDFDYFNQLVCLEMSARGERVGIKFKDKYTYEANQRLIKKENYFPTGEGHSLFIRNSNGFVLEIDGSIRAIATVTKQNQSGSGLLHLLGYTEGSESELGSLFDACAAYVKLNSGNKLTCSTEILPGQIFNQEFDFWMKYGFKPEPYYSQWAVCHDLTKWEVREDLNIDNVTTVSELDLEEIIGILQEDGEDYIAGAIRYDFEELSPIHIFLKLVNPDNGEVNAIAYYQVYQDHKGTNTLGIHIRPQLNDQSSYEEIQRFVRCVMASMKQLDFTYAGSRMSSRNLLSMIALCAEGFLLSPTGQVILYRLV